ncbi:VOC family protein [Cytobacillus sp. SAFR-174]|uniref:VOC family protein n=1 Tax=Cytobacillus sp. SAFR-174 TaxID=3436868 RepID=UPI003F807268
MAKVVGFELNCQDPEKAAEFYSKVFNWEIEERSGDIGPSILKKLKIKQLMGVSV